MKVVLITSQELNEDNLLSSSFELSRAKALQQKGVQSKILSAGFVTPRQLMAVMFQKLKRKVGWHYRFQHWTLAKTVRFLVLSPFYLLSKKAFVNTFIIDGIEVVEAFYLTRQPNKVPSFYKLWTYHILKGYKLLSSHFIPDVVHAHSRFLLAGHAAMEIKKRFGVPFVLTEHSSNYFRGVVQPFEADIMRTVMQEAKYNIAVSKALAYKINEVLGTHISFEIVPNVLDSLFNQSGDVYHNTGDQFMFLHVASLLPVKKQKNLLDAFAILKQRLPEIQLNIVGDGELFRELQQQIEYLQLENSVFLKGKFQREEVLHIMKQCHAFVLSSQFETFGVVLIEALACGKPVVSTRCGGPEEIITDQNGILVPVNDVTALANAMFQIYRNYDNYNPDLIRNECLSKYGAETIANKLISIYDRAIFRDPVKAEGSLC